MPTYVMNKNHQLNGDHEVHDLEVGVRKNCLPLVHNRRELGSFSTCQAAVAVAQVFDPRADGCAYCIPACHTR